VVEGNQAIIQPCRCPCPLCKEKYWFHWRLQCCLYEISWSPRNLFARWRFWDDWRYWKEGASVFWI